MLKRILIATFILVCITATAQPDRYGHEWISFDNNQPALKIKVLQDGLYRVDFDQLEAAFSQTGTPIAQVDPRNIAVFNKGKQIPVYIEGESDGSFDNGDFVEFYGQRNDGWLDQFLYDEPWHRANKHYSNFSDTAIYFLTVRPNPGFTKKRLQPTENNVSNPGPKRQYFMKTKVAEYHNNWNPGQNNYTGGFYLYSPDYSNGEGFLGSEFNKSTQNRNITLDGIFTSGPVQQATVFTNLVSYFDQNHRIRFSINNNVLFDTSFFGQGVRPLVSKADLGMLSEKSSNEFRFEALGTGSSDRNAIGFIEVTYPSTFDFNNASTYDFKLHGPRNQTAYFEIENFDSDGQEPILIDQRNQTRLLGNVSDGVVKFNLPFPLADTAEIHLSSVEQLRSPVAITPASFRDLSASAAQGDYLLIYHPSLLNDGSGNNWVEAYVDYRESMAGGSHNVVAISVNTVYDQFGYGIDRHPMAIQNFISYALDSFNMLARNVFLVGKGVEYDRTRTDPGNRNLCLIPPASHPGGDMAYTMNGQDRPLIAIGRLSARNGTELFRYLEKVKALETNQDPTSGGTIKDKNWMRNVLHFGGGESKGQQDQFKQFLGNYENKLNGPFFGGRVSSFYKTSSDPIQFVQSQYLDSIITSGTSLITFFGHSSENSFDVNLDKPENYNNFGRTPVIVSNGCFSGQIFGTGRGISEKFVLQEGGGAIGFLASTSYGEPFSLHAYSSKLLDNLIQHQYGEGLGTSIMHTVRFVLDSMTPNYLLRYLAQQNTLHGDPAIRINAHPKPDYAIEPQYVSFQPENVSVDHDSFTVNVHIHNIGKAIKDSFTVEVRRTFADGSFALQSRKVAAPFADKTVELAFYTDPQKGVNRNEFEVILDAGNGIDEISETNNTATATLDIRSQEAFPVYPYEYGITSDPVILRANTSDLLAGPEAYQMEIDTTELFNSPMKQKTTITASGGVVEWENPPVAFQDETVYYWRISPEFSHPDSAGWNSSSFLYSMDQIAGWNQSHIYQLMDNGLENLNYNDKKLQYIDDIKELGVTNGMSSSSNVSWEEVTAYTINGGRVNRWSCLSQGIVIAPIDGNTGLPWRIEDYDFGEVECYWATQRGAFHFRTGNVSQRKLVVDFLDSIPDGTYLLVMSLQRPDYKAWKSDTGTLGTSIIEKLVALGGTDLYHIDTLKIDSQPYTAPFIFFTQKGVPGTSHTLIGKSESVKLDTTFTISGKWTQGFVHSSNIGPAKNYKSLSWDFDNSADPVVTDFNSLKVVGKNSSQQKTLLVANSKDTSLTGTNASTYPNLELEYFTRDDSFHTPSQLTKWRVLYDPVGDVSANPAMHFETSADTLRQGEEFTFSVALQNISDYDMDSLLVAVYHVNANNEKSEVWKKRFRPLPGNDTIIVDFDRNTLHDEGRNTIIVEANPGLDQPEQHTFNNTLFLPYTVRKDRQNPVLDVTFDGVRIMDGDIVSARPVIHVELEDENRHLPLNDTSLLNLFVHYPDGNRKRVAFDNPDVNFVPAEGDNLEDNKAEIIYNARFKMDGTHELRVRASDKSGNRAGDLDYRISFRVINETMISNVFNYPNPFTSSTQFVFTLTGAEVPENIRIQIMTVTGRVVREITKHELGPLHIGTNRTEFRWDGTDEFGDPLANGLYLYRVFAADADGTKLKNYELEGNADRFFENGIGKMYLAR